MIPKSHKDMVAAVFRTTFAQPDPAAVSAAWDEVRDHHVGIAHAGHTLDVEPADRTIRVYHPDGAFLVEVPRATTKSISRFKARRPEPSRSCIHRAGP